MFQHALDAFVIAGRLIDELEEFSHLTRARVAWLWGPSPLPYRGGHAWAYITVPTVQGLLRDLFEHLLTEHAGDELDFLVLIDAEYWLANDQLHRERLVYHELSHVHQKTNTYGVPQYSKIDGRPLLKLVPHDTEVFHREIARYGPSIVGLEAHLQALAEGRQAEERLRRASPA